MISHLCSGETLTGGPAASYFFSRITLEIARWCVDSQPEVADFGCRVATESILVWFSEKDVGWPQIAVYDCFPVAAHGVVLYYTSFEKQSRNA